MLFFYGLVLCLEVCFPAFYLQKMRERTCCLLGLDRVTFSVIVPVFNVESYLSACLESILPALTAADEIILSLGHSADDSTAIAERCTRQHANIHLLWQDGKGLSNARNCAVREARGTYVLYIDSDDLVDTALFAHALQDIREDTAPKELYVFDFYHDNRRTGCLEPRFQIGAGGDFQGVAHIDRMLRRHQCFWNVWRFIYRRDFLERNGITFLENRMSEDMDYTTSVLLAQPDAAFYHTPYYRYAVGRGTSLMDRPTLRRLEDTVFVLERSIRRLREAALPYSDCVTAQLQFEYVLNMAQLYEIPAADRAAGRQLFADAREILSGGRDRLVRLLRLLLRLTGLTATAYFLHTAKKLRRTLKQGKKGKTA